MTKQMTDYSPDDYDSGNNEGELPATPSDYWAKGSISRPMPVAAQEEIAFLREDTPDLSGPVNEAVNMVAATPEIYQHAHAFMAAVFGDEQYTPDSIGQLVDVFVPCLRIMVERGYEPTGALWRRAGLFGVMTDVRKKFDRFWYRTWTLGRRHDDSGFDLINFTGMSLRAEPDSRWGELGEPARPNSGGQS